MQPILLTQKPPMELLLFVGKVPFLSFRFSGIFMAVNLISKYYMLYSKVLSMEKHHWGQEYSQVNQSPLTTDRSSMQVMLYFHLTGDISNFDGMSMTRFSERVFQKPNRLSPHAYTLKWPDLATIYHVLLGLEVLAGRWEQA